MPSDMASRVENLVRWLERACDDSDQLFDDEMPPEGLLTVIARALLESGALDKIIVDEVEGPDRHGVERHNAAIEKITGGKP